MEASHPQPLPALPDQSGLADDNTALAEQPEPHGADLLREGPPEAAHFAEIYGVLMLSSGAMTNRINRL